MGNDSGVVVVLQKWLGRSFWGRPEEVQLLLLNVARLEAWIVLVVSVEGGGVG